MTECMEECKREANQINLPLRVMHGGKDLMTAPQGSKLLFETISSTDKELRIYDDAFHEIFNEPEGEEIFTEMANWMESRL